MSEVLNGDAGRIGFLIKGNYKSTETYNFLDVVYHSNSSYVAKKETFGNIPQENNEYWQILAKGGISGTAGVVGVKGNAEDTYRTGEVNLTKENLGISVMSTEHIGLGKPDGDTITADEDGTLHAKTSGETDDYASKTIYGDNSVSLGRVKDSEIGNKSFAFGSDVAAIKSRSVSFGNQTKSEGTNAFSYGSKNTASGENSFAGGYYTSATNYASHVGGKYNAAMTTGGDVANTTGHAFVIGNGTGSAKLSNAFSIMYSGVVKAKSTITASTNADYAEFFEWLDGNPNSEDRVGRFVTLDGNKIRIADPGDGYILGIVSGEPFVLGNGDCDTWNGMFLRDDFNRTIYEPAPLTEFDKETGEIREVLDENGNNIYKGTRPALNPNYKPDEPYVSRFDRPEWSPVGMLGVLSVYDDGSCLVNGYCTCGNDGVATVSEAGYRVVERVKDNIVKVVFR